MPWEALGLGGALGNLREALGSLGGDTREQGSGNRGGALKALGNLEGVGESSEPLGRLGESWGPLGSLGDL